MQVKMIAASNIVDYSEQLATALLEGYTLDFSEDNSPRHFASLYAASLVKVEPSSSEIVTNNSSPVSEANKPTKVKAQKGV